MSRFTQGLKIIPTPARVIAALIYILAAVGFWAIFTFSNDPGSQGMPFAGKVAIIAFASTPLVCWVLLIGYVNADAKRRGMRYVMWTLLAIFIPNAIGIIVYFILRDPLPRMCPQCSQLVKAGFAYCPHCGYNLAPACPSCKRAVEPSWKICPTCGTSLAGVAPVAPLPPPYVGPQNA
jgi:RNA polymerase subunit RPABC4/transcription elongation factor Spt4/putative flippase GtrA